MCLYTSVSANKNNSIKDLARLEKNRMGRAALCYPAST